MRIYQLVVAWDHCPEQFGRDNGPILRVSSHLPHALSGREVVRALEKIGYVVDRQRGSHIILRQQTPPTDGLLFLITKKSPRERYEPLFGKRD